MLCGIFIGLLECSQDMTSPRMSDPKEQDKSCNIFLFFNLFLFKNFLIFYEDTIIIHYNSLIFSMT